MAAGVDPLTWTLADAGMDLFERAGLAALYMSLQAAEEMEHDLSPLFWESGDLKSDSVTVQWKTTPKEAFLRLFEWAWQLRNGVLYFPAIHGQGKLRENDFLRVPMHSGILRTFLQHPRVQPKGTWVKRLEAVQENEQIVVQYQPLKSAQLKPLTDLKKAAFFTQNGEVADETVNLSGWVVPGVAPRFASEQAWEGPAKLGLLLMLAPIACAYQHLRGEGDNWVVLVPDVRDLDDWAESRPKVPVHPKYAEAASLGDAGLRFLSSLGVKNYPLRCRAIAMGQARYYGKRPNQDLSDQRIRKAIVDMVPDAVTLNRYAVLDQVMNNSYRPPAAETNKELPSAINDDDDEPTAETGMQKAGKYRVPSARGRIADNLVAVQPRQPWYADLFRPLTWQLKRLEWQRKTRKQDADNGKPNVSIEKLWFENLSGQQGELRELVSEKAMWDSEDERIFLRVMHDMLSTLIWKENKALQRGGSADLAKRIERLIERLRSEFENAKTRPLLRDTLSKWLVKGGTHDDVRQHSEKVWGLMNHPHDWQKARDLARLALITYESRSIPVSEEPDWSVLSEELQAKLDHNPDRGRLRFIGAMSEDERDALRDLFTTPKDQNAIDELYRKSQQM